MADVGQPQLAPQTPAGPLGPEFSPQPLGPPPFTKPLFPLPGPPLPHGFCRPGFGDYWISAPGPGGIADVRGLQSGFSESDRRTIGRLLVNFKSARVAAGNKDAAKAAAAWERLLTLTCYAAGFFDGKRIVMNGGFASVMDASSADANPDRQLDAFQQTLEKLVAETRVGGLLIPGILVTGLFTAVKIVGEALKT